MTYGQCENSDVVYGHDLVPMGLTDGCRVAPCRRAGSGSDYADLEIPEGRLSDRLRREQDMHFMQACASEVRHSSH